MRTARLASVLVLVAASAPWASARRVGMPQPVLEALVRGEPVPASLPGAGGSPHPLDDADLATLRELVRAHAANDPAPFRKAFDRGAPWLVRAALESLAITRVVAGGPTDPLPVDAVRREDEAFVKSFLPDLVRLSADADLRPPALAALGALAVRGLDEETRAKARDALLSGLIAWGEVEAVRILGRLLWRNEGDVPLSPAQKEGIRRVLLQHVEDPPPEAWRVAAAVSSPQVVAAARTRGGEWLPYLATVGHPDVPALVVEALSRPRVPGSGSSVMAALEAAAIRPDPTYLPALETFTPGAWDAPLRAIAAIEDPVARPLLERWARTGSRLAAERWLALDRAGALTWLRHEAREGTPRARAGALRVLAEAGEPDLLPSIRALLQADKRTRYDALEALGQVARRPQETAARDLALSLAGESDPDQPVVALLEAVHHADAAALETALLERLGALPASPDWRHVAVIGALGRAGGTRSLAALAEWTAWREPADPDCFDVHLVARLAVGRIERRLGL